MTESDVQLVQSLSRGLAVIRAFDGTRPRQTLAQVAEVTGLPRATTRRFLHTLVAEGFARTDGTVFWLTPKTLELGYSYLSSLELPAIAQPHLEALSHQLNESCSASVLDGTDVVYVARSAANRIMSVNITIGTRFPAHATSMGRMLLSGFSEQELDAYLDGVTLKHLTPRTITNRYELQAAIRKAAEQGYCIVDEELELGLRSVACPVTNGHGEVVAAVNVSAHVAAYSLDQLRETLLPPLKETADAISSDIITTKK